MRSGSHGICHGGFAKCWPKVILQLLPAANRFAARSLASVTPAFFPSSRNDPGMIKALLGRVVSVASYACILGDDYARNTCLSAAGTATLGCNSALRSLRTCPSIPFLEPHGRKSHARASASWKSRFFIREDTTRELKPVRVYGCSGGAVERKIHRELKIWVWVVCLSRHRKYAPSMRQLNFIFLWRTEKSGPMPSCATLRPAME